MIIFYLGSLFGVGDLAFWVNLDGGYFSGLDVGPFLVIPGHGGSSTMVTGFFYGCWAVLLAELPIGACWFCLLIGVAPLASLRGY